MAANEQQPFYMSLGKSLKCKATAIGAKVRTPPPKLQHGGKLVLSVAWEDRV